MINTLKNQIIEIEKGCGKEFMYLLYNLDMRRCGQIEDLKHSNILLCKDCKLEISILQSCLALAINTKEKLKERISGNIFMNDADYVGVSSVIDRRTALEEIEKTFGGNK